MLESNFAIRYHASVVKVPLQIGNNIHSIDAIAISEIRTKLSIPGLSECAKAFQFRGYSLADEGLVDGSDEVANLEFVMGTNNPELLIEKPVLYLVNMINQFSLGLMLEFYCMEI